MSKSRETIDYLDLYIAIPQAIQEVFSEFLADFIDNHIYIEIQPKLKEGVLLINSTDLVAFTGYIQPSRCNELDLFRFKAELKKQQEKLLTKKDDRR